MRVGDTSKVVDRVSPFVHDRDSVAADVRDVVGCNDSVEVSDVTV